MKTLTAMPLATLLISVMLVVLVPAEQAHATVICRSANDPTFIARFPGYSCPPGYFMAG